MNDNIQATTTEQTSSCLQQDDGSKSFAVMIYVFQNPGISKDYNFVFRAEVSCIFQFGFREYFVTTNASGHIPSC